jgi:hypothetical protein
MDVAWPFLIPIAAIIGAFTVAIVNSLARARVRELEIRERIAMIEKGLVPAPEVDPRGFDRAMGRIDRLHGSPRADKLRGGGVVLMGVGLGLMLLISLEQSPREGVAVGGFIMILGAAIFLSAKLHFGSTSSLGDASSTPVAGPVPRPDQNR